MNGNTENRLLFSVPFLEREVGWLSSKHMVSVYIILRVAQVGCTICWNTIIQFPFLFALNVVVIHSSVCTHFANKDWSVLLYKIWRAL